MRHLDFLGGGLRADRRRRRPVPECLEGRHLLAISIVDFPLPTPDNAPTVIKTGPDGNLWFTEQASNKIARISPTTRTVTEFPIPTTLPPIVNPVVINPTGSSFPTTIDPGPDGNLWFTELYGNKIGRITLDGIITEFPLPPVTPTPPFNPYGSNLIGAIVTGPDGNLYFGETAPNKIARITPTGTITEFPIPTPNADVRFVTTGPDGNLWFTEFSGNKIARMTPSGVFTEFPDPTTVPPVPFINPTGSSEPRGITAGPDGNLWFTEYAGDKVGRITPDGIITEFPLPTHGSLAFGLSQGPDGNIWFAESGSNKIGQITPSGILTEFPVPTTVPATPTNPTGSSMPLNLTIGPDGKLWFVEQASNKLGQITLPIFAIGTLAPSSDSGVSQTDHITNMQQPTLTGKAEPGAVVHVFAWRSDGLAVPLGQATAGSGGDWSLTTAQVLASGSYTITATATDPSGQSSAPTVLLSVAVHGPLVIDTQGPRVTKVTVDAHSGQIFMTFRDDLSGLNQSALVDPANYQLVKWPIRKGNTFTLTTSTPSSPTDPQTVVMTVNGGQPIRRGVLRLRIDSSGLTDRAGNVLDGKSSGVFPSGNHRNGDFLAWLVTNGKTVRVRPVKK